MPLGAYPHRARGVYHVAFKLASTCSTVVSRSDDESTVTVFGDWILSGTRAGPYEMLVYTHISGMQKIPEQLYNSLFVKFYALR